jgi:hypothetical protein
MFGGKRAKQAESENMEDHSSDQSTKSNTWLMVSFIVAFLFLCLFIVFGVLAPVLKFWPYTKCPETSTPPAT